MKKLFALASAVVFLFGQNAYAGSPVTIQNSQNTIAATVDSGGLHVVCTSGCSGGSGGNASVGANSATAPTSSTQIGIKDASGNLQPVSATNPIPISGTITASLGGFTPTAGATAALSASAASANVALPAGVTVVVANTGSAAAFVRLTTGAGTAVTTDQIIPAGGVFGFTAGTATFLDAITASGTTSLALQGGTGLFTNVGAGGSGGGGGGAITAASGSYSSGALSAGAIVDIGTGASPAANTVNSNLGTINTTLGTLFKSGQSIANITGTVSLPTGAATSALQTTGNTSLASLVTGINIATQSAASLQAIPTTTPVTTPGTIASTTGVAASSTLKLLEVQSASALTGNLYLCFKNQTCSTTVYDRIIPSGAAAGVLYTSPFGFTTQTNFYYNSTTPIVISFTQWQ